MSQAGGSRRALRQKRVWSIQGAASFSIFSEASGKYLCEDKREKSMHGFCEVPRIGKFRGTESRIELTRDQEQEERGNYYLWLRCFLGG